ncbi:MAG: helix-turn-helix transcriptional regulator, partial [Oscillospiraceae bacterium]
NISPEEYLLKVRMTKASDMLVGTDNSILKIATAVGYKDLSHFSSVFKRFFGIAPTTYRYRKGEETIYV